MLSIVYTENCYVVFCLCCVLICWVLFMLCIVMLSSLYAEFSLCCVLLCWVLFMLSAVILIFMLSSVIQSVVCAGCEMLSVVILSFFLAQCCLSWVSFVTSVVMLSFDYAERHVSHCYKECRSAEGHHANSRGAPLLRSSAQVASSFRRTVNYAFWRNSTRRQQMRNFLRLRTKRKSPDSSGFIPPNFSLFAVFELKLFLKFSFTRGKSHFWVFLKKT